MLLLYAHYEGFCKFAFQLYVATINREQLTFSGATSAVATASITEIIAQLSDSKKKSDYFRHSLPQDEKLHRFYRQREFLQQFEEMQMRPVVIPESALDFESNLKPVVLKKNLFMLGLHEERFSAFDGQISQLLKARNDIAHGSSSAGVDSTTYARLRRCSLTVMAGVLNEISAALASQDYRKHVPIPLASNY